MPKQLDRSVLEMALIGYQRSLENIEEKIADIQRQLGIRPPKAAASVTTGGAKPKRRMSAVARKRIALAQKRRWAAFHQAEEPAPAKKTAVNQAAPKKAVAKRKLSPARKAALLANLAKARAAKAAKRTKGQAVPF
jgi:hypothetical protein